MSAVWRVLAGGSPGGAECSREGSGEGASAIWVVLARGGAVWVVLACEGGE